MINFTTSLIKLIHRHVKRIDWREGQDYSVLDSVGFSKHRTLGYWPETKSYIFRRYLAGFIRQYWCIHDSYFERVK